MSNSVKSDQANLDILLFALALDRGSATSLQEQLGAALRDLILTGRHGGTRLPASRLLAAELSVSRMTVTAVYDQLVAEGYLQTRRGAGTFVARDLPQMERPAARMPTAGGQPRQVQPFQPGLPDAGLFPHRAWARCLDKAWRQPDPALLTRADPFGWYPLRATIAAHLESWRGLRCAPEQIVVTAGAWDAYDILCHAILAPGTTVALEDPGWPAVHAMLTRAGAHPLPLPIDAEGLNPSDLAGTAAGAVVVTPSRHFPMGPAMPLPRRLGLLDWARPGRPCALPAGQADGEGSPASWTTDGKGPGNDGPDDSASESHAPRKPDPEEQLPEAWAATSDHHEAAAGSRPTGRLGGMGVRSPFDRSARGPGRPDRAAGQLAGRDRIRGNSATNPPAAADPPVSDRAASGPAGPDFGGIDRAGSPDVQIQGTGSQGTGTQETGTQETGTQGTVRQATGGQETRSQDTGGHRPDRLVIEDDYDSEFRYQGRPLPSLSGLDGLRNTIYLGSFSKLLSPALRIGYMVLPEALTAPVRDYLSVSGARASLMPQPALAMLMESGDFARHLRRMRRVYAERQRLLLTELAELEDLLDLAPDPSGMHLCIPLRPSLQTFATDRQIVDLAQKRGIAPQALSRYGQGASAPQGLLLGYTALPEPELIRGAAILRDLLRELAGEG